MDARRLLLQPLAWDELKRALRSKVIRIESVGQALSLTRDRLARAGADPARRQGRAARRAPASTTCSPSSTPSSPSSSRWPPTSRRRSSARPRASSSTRACSAPSRRREGLRPLDRGAVGARGRAGLAPGGRRGEAAGPRRDAWPTCCARPTTCAGEAGAARSSAAAHVQAALDAQVRRASRVRERIQEDIRRGTLLIDTRGRGGRPGERARRCCSSAATPSAGPAGSRRGSRLGSGSVVDIEKEVALGGPIHSKGVLILAGFLGQRFASERPLSLAASLVFEQSYSGVEGDSASCARARGAPLGARPRCRCARAAPSPAP